MMKFFTGDNPRAQKEQELSQQRVKLAQEQLNEARQNGDEEAEAEAKAELREANKEAIEAKNHAQMGAWFKDLKTSLQDTFAQKVDEAVKILEDTELKANTRLMGSAKQFSSTFGGIFSNSNAILDKI